LGRPRYARPELGEPLVCSVQKRNMFRRHGARSYALTKLGCANARSRSPAPQGASKVLRQRQWHATPAGRPPMRLQAPVSGKTTPSPSQRGLAPNLIFAEDQDCHIADRSPACGPPSRRVFVFLGQPVSDLGRANRPTLVDIAWQIVFRLGFPLARIWWRLRRVRHEGALAAIHVGQSLLVLRSSYRSAWNFPGSCR
jgi:hypothetical protein